MKKICLLCFFWALALGAGEFLQVSRNGNSILLKSDFPGGYVLNQPLHTGGPNGQLNFSPPSLIKAGSPAIKLSHSSDDACPWKLNSTYIGANHGDSIASGLIFSKPHGLTESDCGSEWTDRQGRKFYVLKIEKPDVLWVLSQNVSKDPAVWSFIRPAAGQPLLCADGRELKDFKVDYRQLRSPLRIVSRKFLADGRELANGQTVRCSVFSVEEEYDIVATDAILRHVIANKGRQVTFNAPGLERLLNQKIIYTFYPDGSCIVTHDTRFFRDAKLEYMGFVQAGQMIRGNYGKHLYYIPKTRPFRYDNQEWDFAGMVDYTRSFRGFMRLKPDSFEDRNNMPERFIQYLKDGKGQPNVGFAVGYSMLEGCTVPKERAGSTATAIFLYQTHKSYPHAVSGEKIGRIKAGRTFHCVAYRQYFDPNQGFYMNRQGKYLVMYVDFHEPVSGKRISLPENLIGKTEELLEKSPSVRYRRDRDGLVFDSTGKYGYCVLKFAQPDLPGKSSSDEK